MNDVLRNASYETYEFDGLPVHYVDYDGACKGPVFVLIHGLGGSHLNWDLLVPELSEHGYVLAIDLPGFGRTEPLGRDCSVEANVEVVKAFLNEVTGRAVLVGNSMGGAISTLVAASTPLVEGLVLLDPALPLPVPCLGPLGRLASSAYLWAAEKLLGAFGGLLTPELRARAVMAACGVDGDTLPEWFVGRAAALMAERRDEEAMEAALFQAARSCVGLMLDPSAYWRVLESVAAPVLLLHGSRDRLVPVASARLAAERLPAWRYVELGGVGHVPQIECPSAVVEEIVDWLAV